MKASTFLKSGNFVKKEDIEKGSKRYTIRGVETVDFKDKIGGLERRLQLVFDNDHRFTLNATNIKRLVRAFGDDTAAWVGHSIVLVFDPDVEYAGRVVGGIRVRVPAKKNPEPEPEPDWNDDLEPEVRA